MKVSKIQQILINAVTIDRTKNVREDDAYEVSALKEDLKLRGQQEPAALEKIGDAYVPIKGFRRATAILELAAEGAINPKTVKFDSDGKPVANTGKPFESIEALVYEGLSDRERLELLLDHGQRRGLSKVELQNSFERGFQAMYTEKELATILFSLLEHHYPPNKSIENTAEAKLNYYRGVIQTAKHAYRAPDVLHDKWMLRLKGTQAWPTKAEMVEMSTIHQKESDGKPQFNKKNPGPKFMERWTAYLKKVEEATKEGNVRPKSDSMMNRQQVEEATKACDSLILKTFGLIIQRRIPQDKLAVLDKIMTDKVESIMSDEVRQLIIGLNVTEEPAPETNDSTKVESKVTPPADLVQE